MTIGLQVLLSPNVFWLAERNKDAHKRTSATAVLSLCHLPATLWFSNLFHSCIIHLLGETGDLQKGEIQKHFH